MATSNDINPDVIDQTYPVAGQDNDSQGFRDNFQNIKTAITNAKSAIGTLETTSADVTSDNSFNDNVIRQAVFQDVAGKVVSDNINALAGEIDFQSGPYRIVNLGTDKGSGTNTITITNWAPAESCAKLTLDLKSGNTNNKLVNFSSPSGTILVDHTISRKFTNDTTGGGEEFGFDSDLTTDLDLPFADADDRYIFEVWSPNQGTGQIFIKFIGLFRKPSVWEADLTP